MSKTILAALVIAGALACRDRNRQDSATLDSLDRDLRLAPVDTTAPLGDRATSPRAPARTPPRAAASPAPTADANRGLAPGTTIAATTTAEIRSNKNKVGDEIGAAVSGDVKDAAGRVVIPAGSVVTLRVTAIKPSENKSDSTGTLTLQPTEVVVNGTSYPLRASIQKLDTKLEGRKTGAGDVAKVGGGAVAGAVVGRVLGGSTKGAVIGGIIGGAVGAQRAVETKDRDVVVPQGTVVTMVLEDRLIVGR